MTIETPQQRKPLKTVISKAILLPALFVVVLIALAAVIGASILGASSGNAAANALQSQIELHIDASASESAVSIHQQLSHWQRSLTMLAYFGRELFETSPLANQYNGNELFKTPTGAPFFDQGDSLVDAQRFNSSVFYLPETTSGSLSLNAIQKIDATVSQQIDPAFVAVMRDTPSIAALYVGFQSSGVFRRFPPQEVDTKRQYDSRKRGWYTAAVDAGGSPVFTSPYVDAFGLGWMITIAQQIRLPSGGFAVFGADVLLETLVANVRAVSFAETGYGFLYDRRTGETVAHPAFEMEASDDANAVAPQVSVYERDLPEFGAFEKIVDDGETLWTFQDVNNDYRYVVTVSLDEVLKPSQEVGTLAKTLIGVVVAAVVVLGLLAVLATYLAITFYVKAVVNSVQKLGDKAEELTSLIGNGYAGDEKRVQELDEKFVDDNDINRISEVAECSQAYTDAVKRLKAGQSAQRPNPFYYGARGRPWREGNEKDLKFAAEFSDFDIAVKNNKAVQSKTTLKQFAMKRLLIPVFIIVFLFVAITTAVMAGTYFEVVKEADAATLSETKAQLQRTTRQRSALLGDFFQESLSANRLNRDFIRGVMFDGWYDGGNLNLIRPKLANPEPNARDRTLTSSSNANYGASLWYTPPPITPVAALPALDLERLDNASLLYIPSRAITDAIDEFFAVYLGAESDGLWISHPYIRYSPPLSEQKFVSAKDGKSVTGYDPRIRTWYVNGSAVFGETEDGILSPPYVDVATNKVIITAALPYADNLDEFAGVAAIDIDATVLKQATVARAFSANDGYTYVLNEDLAIVIHPIADVGKVQGLQDVEFPASSAETELEERLEFELTLSKLRALNNSGSIDFEKSGETWHAAFENTNAGDLIVLTVISNDGAVAPASAVYDAYVTVIVVFVVLVVLLSACLFYSLYRRVEHSLNPAVVGPLNEVNRLLNGEGKPQINDESSKYTSQEIAEVKSLCENSIVAMQFASPESAAAPAERRLGVYADAHKLFDKLQCEYGVGVCKNNEAQATSEMELNKSANKPADNSVQLYLESIEHAKHMLSKETDEQRRRTLQRSLCMRYMSLASVYFHREQYNNAVRTYNEAVTLADQFAFDDVRVTAFLTLADVEQKQCNEQMHVCGNPFGGSKKAVARDKKSKKNKKKEKIDEEKLDAVDPSSARIDAANVEKVKTNFAEWLSVTYACETSKYYIAAALLTCKFKTHEDLLTLNGRDSDSRTDQKQPLLKFKDSDLELQRAQANVRLFFANHLDSKESPQLIGAALETSPVVDTNTFIGAGQACNSLKTLPGVTSVVQSVVGASSAHRRGGGSGEKLALLMLVDKTGSMAGSKINTARDNVVKIYEEHCLIGDSIAVYHYNTATTKFMSFQTRTVDNEQRLLSQLKANIRAGGMTASYDALIQAFDAFSVDQRLKSKCFIIMLTDGDDGSSRKKVADVKRTISSHDDINLIVLTVHAGHAASSTWAGIVEHAKRNNHGTADVFLHIDVESGQGMDAVDAAFAKAASVMSAARGIEAL